MIIRSSADVGNDGIKCLIYGRSGVGKTPTLATAPTPIILSGEKGLLSIKRCNPPVPYIEFTNYKELCDAYSWASNSHEARQFYTIGLDSLTEVSDVILAKEIPKGNAHGRAYGETYNQVLTLVRAIQNIQGHSVIVVAKEEYDTDTSTGTKIFQPAFPGNKLGQATPYFFDETFRMLVGKDSTGKDVRYFRTRLSATEAARDRSGMLDEFEPANLTYIFKKILGI